MTSDTNTILDKYFDQIAVSVAIGVCFLVIGSLVNLIVIAKQYGNELTERSTSWERTIDPASKPLDRPVVVNMVPRGESLMRRSDCFSCHKMNERVLGPAFHEVAQKYSGDSGALELLMNKVKVGGSGTWGPIAMNPHPSLSERDLREMIRTILSPPTENTDKKTASGP